MLQKIADAFKKMGSRIKIFDVTKHKNALPFTINILKDKHGEYFEIKWKKQIVMTVPDIQPRDRHLLLVTRDLEDRDRSNKASTNFYLCGHDERNWFVSAIPHGAISVQKAKELLKPKELIDFEVQHGLKSKKAHKHHRTIKAGTTIHRQGEFVFIPTNLSFDNQPLTPILKNEPMRKSAGSNPHIAEYLYRSGGSTVYISLFNLKSKIQGFTQIEYDKIMKTNPKAKTFNWVQQRVDMAVYVKGTIKHKDHKTLNLGNIWHKVLMNTETRGTPGTGPVRFFD
jgi:hypothetical protein